MRPDEAVGSEIKWDGDGGMMESAISEYVEDGHRGMPVANTGIDAGLEVHPGQDAGLVAGGKGEDPHILGVWVCNEARELARAVQDKGSIREPGDEGWDGNLYIVCRHDSKAVDKFGNSLQDEVQSCKHKSGLDPSLKAWRDAGSRGRGKVHERRQSAVSSGGTSVSWLTPHFIGSICQNWQLSGSASAGNADFPFQLMFDISILELLPSLFLHSLYVWGPNQGFWVLIPGLNQAHPSIQMALLNIQDQPKGHDWHPQHISI